MPEVVEVCLTALWLNEKLAGKELTKLVVLGGRYSRHTLEGLSLIDSYGPFKINEINSKGKFLWFELTGKNNKTYYILNRFGLEGEWGFTKQEHSGIQLVIGALNLYFTDSRNFGTIEIVNNKKSLDRELDKMGPDLLKTTFTNDEFYKRVEDYVTKGKGSIVKTRGDKEIIKVLMDQSISGGLGSGLGNYLGVEILYDSEISPHKTMKQLYQDKKLVFKLAKSIKYILKLSFLTTNIGYLEHLDESMASFIKKLRKEINDDKNNPYNFHPDIVFDKNDEFKFKVYRQKLDPLGNSVIADKIITGRTTYWAPVVQR